ncbi:OsmC family protein [Roseibacterium sp. SDUM158017]|uniref:OsmC family protein n=1 Tax=Roseicyclus salinarum TaxID=3036773 RepID=UPI00241574E1|nr:OsmC family protein [Roseibacterium sp. SDUM158017]MDG4648120.1 OsmC family protein [Roseibacterium sp. SDUM158017]
MKKHGNAVWQGDLKTGTGEVSTQSGAMDAVPYGFNKRFADEPGTNPEELIGAAHASCFAMALSMILGQEGLTPERLEATSTVSLEEKDGGFAITKAHLDLTARIPGADDDTFRRCAEAAKENCPVSKVLAGAEITLEARLA